jgi:hypothetical protein
VKMGDERHAQDRHQHRPVIGHGAAPPLAGCGKKGWHWSSGRDSVALV